MKLKKLFKKAETFLDSDERSRKEKKKCVKHLLKKLRKYQVEVNAKLKEATTEEERKLLQKKVALTHAQRKKGLILLSDLKKKTKH